ncbi:hypothetical protein Scep_009819 [Stephania cephalantha]|uniref:Uncharacterized protein n=1 Tax=Stephania cephalantha TaxID=152367 RepID=A0AAP0PCT9_9MAGN
MFICIHLYSNICCDDVALAYIDGRRQMVCSLLGGLGGAQLVAEEPNLSRRSPALQSKMGYGLGRVWPWVFIPKTPLSSSARSSREARSGDRTVVPRPEVARYERRPATGAAGGGDRASERGSRSGGCAQGRRPRRSGARHQRRSAARTTTASQERRRCGGASGGGGGAARAARAATMDERSPQMRECSNSSAGDTAKARAATAHARLRDAVNGAVARFRPVGCAISSKSRRRDGGTRSRVSGAQIETRVGRLDFDLRISSYRWFRDLGGESTMPICVVRRACSHAHMGGAIDDVYGFRVAELARLGAYTSTLEVPRGLPCQSQSQSLLAWAGGKDMDMFQLERDFNVPVKACEQPETYSCYCHVRRQMVCCLLGGLGGAQLVAEEPNLSRRSPALQSKMGVWPWASMAFGGERAELARARSGDRTVVPRPRWRDTERRPAAAAGVAVIAQGEAGGRAAAAWSRSWGAPPGGGRERQHQRRRGADDQRPKRQRRRHGGASGGVAARAAARGRADRPQMRSAPASSAGDPRRRARQRLQWRHADAVNGVVAHFRPAGCAISSKSRRRDGGTRSRVLDAQIETRVGRLDFDLRISSYRWFRDLRGESTMPICVVRRACSHAHMGDIEDVYGFAVAELARLGCIYIYLGGTEGLALPVAVAELARLELHDE